MSAWIRDMVVRYDSERGAVSKWRALSMPMLTSPRAKYPIALVARMLEVLGNDVLLGYDIGCVFEGTLTRTSLASAVAAKRWICCVNAMHGYTHEFGCRLRYHPNTIKGMGLEDLETLERLFSSLNAIAAGTRHMTAYRRRVFIDLFLRQWDAEKYLHLGDFLFNNYKQALKIIETNSLDVGHVLQDRGITEDDLTAYIKEEVEYFGQLGQEVEGDVISMNYVKNLQEWRIAW